MYINQYLSFCSFGAYDYLNHMRHTILMKDMFCLFAAVMSHRHSKWPGHRIDWLHMSYLREILNVSLISTSKTYCKDNHLVYMVSKILTKALSYLAGFHWGWHCCQPWGEARRQHADQWVRFIFDKYCLILWLFVNSLLMWHKIWGINPNWLVS